MNREKTPTAALAPVLWRLTSQRHWRNSRRQTLLLLLTLALGVGVYISVRLANRAAVEGFGNFTEVLTGESDFLVAAPAGRLPESVLPQLRSLLGSRPVHLVPVLETTAALPLGEDSGKPKLEMFNLVGLDLVSVQNLRTLSNTRERVVPGDRDEGESLFEILNRPDLIYISKAFAEENSLRKGGGLSLLINESRANFIIQGILPEDPGRPAAPRNLLVMDLPALQEISGSHGFIDRVEVVIPPGPRAAAMRRETRELLAGAESPLWTPVSTSSGRESGENMTQAFRLNLTVLSLIALMVGLYLILQALDAAVVKRRQEIAILRSLGVEARTIRLLWLFEAGVMGLLGGALGLLLGWGGAQFAVRLVGRTVNALYQPTHVEAAQLQPLDAALALALGFIASLAAGWIPARDAAGTPPAQILARSGLDRGLELFRSPWAGFFPIVAGVLLYFFPPLHLEGGSRFPLAGYMTAILWMLGASMLIGYILALFSRILSALKGDSAPWRVAVSRLAHASGRHKLAAAGLLIAVGMAAGMTILIGSFERTMQRWIQNTVGGDLYISSAGALGAASENRIAAETWQSLASDPAVALAEPFHIYPVKIRGIDTFLIGGSLDSPLKNFIWARPPAPGVNLVSGRTAIEPAYVSESFTERFGIGKDTLLEVPTPYGPRTVMIAAVYADYGNERGGILIDGGTLREWFNDEHANRLSVLLKPGQDAELVRQRWLRQFPGLDLRTNSTLRAEILRIFRQTFSITYALQGIALVVAVAGLGLALVSLNLENRGALATLRALGMTRREIATASAIEGFGIALAGTAGGLALSCFLGLLLVYVINKQSFGWTLMFHIPWPALAGLAVTVLFAASVMAYAVGLRGALLPADREE